MMPSAESRLCRRRALSAIAAMISCAALLIFVRLDDGKAPHAGQAVMIRSLKPPTALASEPHHGPALAVDEAGADTGWKSRMPFGAAWWRTDLDEPHRIIRIVVRQPMEDGDGVRYVIEGSLDGSDWFTIAVSSGSKTSESAGVDQYEVTAVARHIRIAFTGNRIGQTAQLSDVQLFGLPVSHAAERVIELLEAGTDKGLYTAGSRVHLHARLHNPSAFPQTVRSVTAKIYGMTRRDFLVEVPLPDWEGMTLSPNAVHQMPERKLWTIPADMPAGAYGIRLQIITGTGRIHELDATFFRIGGAADLTAFSIEQSDYGGLAVLMLDGGMSAEYAVQKAADALEPAISHSWFTSRPGFGPKPVYATPSFLEDAARRTVDFYNDRYGANRKFNTVIIATGVASVPYVARAMHAPVLPLHYLASLDSVRELQHVLDASARSGLTAFSTLGYDASMNPAVAWLKLLDLPDVYADFIRDHQVENVVIMGSFGNIGESVARKVLQDDDPFRRDERAGDIYIMYPQGGTSGDHVQLGSKIVDLAFHRLEEGFRSISDWESGVTGKQLQQFTASLHERTGIRYVDFLSARDTLHLYAFASEIMLAYFKKNEAHLAASGQPVVRGIALNPYLVSHPFYELRMGEIPLLFWQYGNLRDTIDVRLNRNLRRDVARYFPDVKFDELPVRIGTSNNFGKSAATDRLTILLQNNGLDKIIAPADLADEVWDAQDGMNAQAERLALDLLFRHSSDELKAWNDRLEPLSPDELNQVLAHHPHVALSRQSFTGKGGDGSRIR